MRLLVFNPWHEEALAAHSPYYTPTLAAQRQERRYDDCGTLPWAEPGDCVWRPGVSVDWSQVESIEPWGWDLLLRARLRKAGAPERLLPTDAQLEAIRRLSSRATAVRVLRQLRHERFVGKAFLCLTEDEMWRSIRECGGHRVVIKSPYSCSGRGLVFFDVVRRADDSLEVGNAASLRRVQKMLRQQGAVTVEQYCPNDADLALEFFYADGVLTPSGINVFRTTPQGQYIKNVSADVLTADDHVLIDAAREQLQSVLPKELKGDYRGPLGVDMMLSRGCLHPCVEINLRRTMGQF